MDHDETGCQAPPEGPILCVNSCGFFGSSATMNMCSKCHKDMMLKKEQVKLAASSIGKFVNESSNSNANEPVVTAAAVNVNVQTNVPESNIVPELNIIPGPNRCNACRKRVGLTGFSCRCGDLFCSSHRYSDKHGCTFDYHAAAQNAIAEANPVIKPEKLDKI